MAQTPVIIEGTMYPSIKIAAQHLGVSPGYISARLNDPDNPTFERVKQQPKPKRVNDPDGQAGFYVRTTTARKDIFQTAAEILGIEDPAEWFNQCMRTLSLNAVSVLEEDHTLEIDPDILRSGIAEHWNRQARIGNVPADTFD